MVTTMLESSITLERERESNNSKNIATKIAWFVTPKNYILKIEKLVIW